MKITREEFLNTIKKAGHYYLIDCSICGYEMSFSYRDDQFGYDNGCYCTNNRDGWSPRDESDIDFYLEESHGHLPKIQRFIERVKTREGK